MTQNKQSFLSRAYNRYSLLLVIIMVTILVTGGISFQWTGASVGVWALLLITRAVAGEYLKKLGIQAQPTSGSKDTFNRLITLVLIGTAIVFVGYLIFLYLFIW